MQRISKETAELIREYRKLYGEKPEPYWYTEWNSQDDYAEYLKKEIEKFNKK